MKTINRRRDCCLLIQWEEPCLDKKGKPVCPRCKGPAEMVLGVFANPCFAHKSRRKGR